MEYPHPFSANFASDFLFNDTSCFQDLSPQRDDHLWSFSAEDSLSVDPFLDEFINQKISSDNFMEQWSLSELNDNELNDNFMEQWSLPEMISTDACVGMKRRNSENSDNGGDAEKEIKRMKCSEDLTVNGDQTRASHENAKKRRSTRRDSQHMSQSNYARKRRERINERLKTLQNLVPNATKVDISGMLEQAIQYVKFLQLQIKLLSSDELWMYTPLAINGENLMFSATKKEP